MRTSPGPGSGSGRSTTLRTSGPPNSLSPIAFIPIPPFSSFVSLVEGERVPGAAPAVIGHTISTPRRLGTGSGGDGSGGGYTASALESRCHDANARYWWTALPAVRCEDWRRCGRLRCHTFWDATLTHSATTPA